MHKVHVVLFSVDDIRKPGRKHYQNNAKTGIVYCLLHTEYVPLVSGCDLRKPGPTHHQINA